MNDVQEVKAESQISGQTKSTPSANAEQQPNMAAKGVVPSPLEQR